MDEMIAKFMGMRYQIQLGPFGGEYQYVQDNTTKQWLIPAWANSFDWIMPVIEKINSLGGYTEVGFDQTNVVVHLERGGDVIMIPYVYENLKDSLFKGVCIAVEHIMKNKLVY